jgi:energy-coupling factor transporter transmembrane protein EcfT
MTGLLLIFAAVIWLVIALFIIAFIASKIPGRALSLVISIPLFIVLLPMPIMDEIIGGRQFEQLCKENSAVKVNRTTAVGKIVYYVPQPNVEIKGTWVRVVMQPSQFVDATTGELVFSYNTLLATGGRFIRALGISEGNMPLTFNGSCGPEDTKNLVKSLAITTLDPAKQNIKGN